MLLPVDRCGPRPFAQPPCRTLPAPTRCPRTTCASYTISGTDLSTPLSAYASRLFPSAIGLRISAILLRYLPTHLRYLPPNLRYLPTAGYAMP
eukprot:880191-Rhodomonas_salina.2